jgi:flagellar hook-associated protein 3 FlgL
MRKYLNNLNTSSRTLDRLTQKVTTQRQFTKASEDPAAALKVFNIRRDLSRISFYKNNITDLKNNIVDIESTISSLNNVAIEVNTQLTQAKNTTYGQTERNAIASVLKTLQQQVLNNGNTNFAGKFLFGGSNTKQIPFTTDVNGKLLYNGVDVDTGTFSKDEVFVDLGLGMAAGNASAADANTAYNVSYPGSELLGTGVDADGISNNFYNIIGDLITKLETGDLTNIDKYEAKVKEKMDDIIVKYADIGQKSNFVEFISNKLEIDEENSLKKQDTLEAADLAKSIMDVKYQEMSYNAALQVGTKILQNSLLDYLR